MPPQKCRPAAIKTTMVAFESPAQGAARPAPPPPKPTPPVTYRRVTDPLIEPPSVLDTARLFVKKNVDFDYQNALYEQQMAKTTFPEPVPQPPKRLTIDPPPVIETPTTPVMMNGTVFRDTVYYRQFKSHVDCLVAIQVFVLSLAVGYMILKGIRKLTHHETTRERSQRLLNRRRQRLAAIETMLCLPFRIVWFAVRMTAKLLVFIHITLPWFVIVATGYTTAINIRFTGQFLRYCWRIVVPQGQCARCRNRTFALLYGVSMAITRLAAHAHALGPLGLSLTGSSGPLPAWIITIGQIRTYQDFCVMFFVSAILHIPVRQCLQRLHNCYDPWVQRARRTWREDRTGRVMSSILTLPEDILNAPQAGVQLNETVPLLVLPAVSAMRLVFGRLSGRLHTAALQRLLHKS
ncbi:hypothetical protein BC567DRAFT_248439 [Phyllosticta citribraziliensis]